MATSTEVSKPSINEQYYSRGLRERFRLDEQKQLSSDSTPESYADIQYEVNEAKYNARASARLAAGGLERELPAGWPKHVTGPLAWTKGDFPHENEYIYRLTESDRQEIESALVFFKKQGLKGEDVHRDVFPLPNLGKRLDHITSEVYDGRGFVVIRGLNPESYVVEDYTIVFLGITSYVGENRGKQDQQGSMLMHVIKRDAAEARNEDNTEKPFHTDTVCDVLCLVTRSCSALGGKSVLAPGWTVYNELAATRPDLIHTLSKADWPFDTLGRDPSYYHRSVLYYHDGKVIFNFSRRLLVGAPPEHPRTPGIPGLSEAQAEALDAVHVIARKHELRTGMEIGDIRLVNNMGILHRRESFEDDKDNTRHLIRLWLNNELKCWKLPLQLRLAWARVFEDHERQTAWDLEPPRKNGMLLKVAGSCD